MTLEKLKDGNVSIEEKMEALKQRTLPVPDIEKFDNQYDIRKHEIFTNRRRFPDRTIEYENEKGEKKSKRVPLNRIGLPYQKKIVSIATTFFCGTPIKYVNNTEDTVLYDPFMKLLTKVKSEFLDREIHTAVGRWTECAELWYVVTEDNNDYGFTSKFRLKVKVLTPDKYNLYPIFDENDDLVVFSVEYESAGVQRFDVYTKDVIIKYREDKELGWIEDSNEKNAIGKIPIVYYRGFEGRTEWDDVQEIIERLEFIYSNVAETNDKFAYPILALKGDVTGALSKDSGGRVLKMEEEADASFVDQPNANQSLSDEIERLDKDAHDFTNTPNISLGNLQGLGNMLAGSSAEFFFMSAHLKVMEKASIYVPAFTRRAAVVTAWLKMFNVKLTGDIDVTPVITPYVINNEAEFLKMLLSANGNSQIFSLKYCLERLGVKDPDKMIKQIQEEQKTVTTKEKAIAS
ncbi:phage portal protein [Elizabethkingia anophelis]|uniref:Portal protein n=1 Tax=Elizabethkingia anophelis TaxID=1117645 RepID=A0AAU8UQP6_9FLAO|nr:phage portal protein [Elizabethkingia anophelis]AQX00429.1 portal protein [Elizabethkingia anophelis]OPB66197.1 portal protein [Elizabethkingia anophelis]